MSLKYTDMKCPRCGEILSLNPDTNDEIEFYDCTKCNWHYAKKPGEGLHDRWLSPLSIALFSQIFEKHPETTAEKNAEMLYAERPDLVPSILNEIDRELSSPTQRVSEIHDFIHPDEDNLRLHLRKLADALRKYMT